MIDLRSDTVTRPTQAMLDKMMGATVGDDVFGDDPSVNQLEHAAARLMGKEAALLTPSGTQANLLALMSHCQSGDEYIAGQQAHIYRYEAGGGAMFAHVQPQPILFEHDGTLNLNKVAEYIKPDDYHFAKTRLLCLENTQAGKILPLDYLQQAYQFSREHDLSLHIDGARIFNASVAMNMEVKTLSQYSDSINFCLSKGLGAPVGSILCGSQNLIAKARRWRKALGGGMRQAGFIAAAGLYALEHHIDRLKVDHEHAKQLALELHTLDEIDIDPSEVQTNMLFFKLKRGCVIELSERLKHDNILISPEKNMRFVTHLDINDRDVHHVIGRIKKYFSKR